MKTVHEKAYAKLNISLDVGKRREDGFHEMTMVMQSISLADAVTVTLNDTGRVRARTSLPFIPGDERNLAVKAALCYLAAIGRQGRGPGSSSKRRCRWARGWAAAPPTRRRYCGP